MNAMDTTRLTEIAALIADPTRAEMLLALMDGQAKCASELASAANISTSTASHHLAALVKGGVVDVVQEGRHRYHRLAGYQVAELIEILGNLGRGAGPVSKKELLTPCRSCYDHLAGRTGVALRVGLEEKGYLILENDRFLVTASGFSFFESFGFDMAL
jgi:DNA-binding transcriptional ArsR family regulator